jgi:hypothetical protein
MLACLENGQRLTVISSAIPYISCVLLGVTRITFETPMPCVSVTITGHSSPPGLVVTQSPLERIAIEGQRVRREARKEVSRRLVVRSLDR